MDDKYKELKDKYYKKCERIKELKKEIIKLKKGISIRDNYWEEMYLAQAKYRLLCDCIGQQYYKVDYQAKNKSGFMMNFNEVILAPHAKLAIKEIEQKDFEGYKFISFEKVS